MPLLLPWCCFITSGSFLWWLGSCWLCFACWPDVLSRCTALATSIHPSSCHLAVMLKTFMRDCELPVSAKLSHFACCCFSVCFTYIAKLIYEGHTSTFTYLPPTSMLFLMIVHTCKVVHIVAYVFVFLQFHWKRQWHFWVKCLTYCCLSVQRFVWLPRQVDTLTKFCKHDVSMEFWVLKSVILDAPPYKMYFWTPLLHLRFDFCTLRTKIEFWNERGCIGIPFSVQK